MINSLVKERAERVVHMHRISGVSQLAYWTAYGLFDYLIYWMMCGIMVGSMAAFSIKLPPPRILYLALAIYGIIAILFVYTFSLFFKSPAAAQTVLSIVLIIGPYLILGLLLAFALMADLRDPTKYFWLTLIIPSSGIVWPLFEAQWNASDETLKRLSKIVLYWNIVIPIYLVIFWISIGIINRHWLEELFSKTKHIKPRTGDVDPDVLAQEELIKSGNANPEQYPLVAKGLRKVLVS
jgi:hypothetical protein